jgi:phosphatidylethanolamine-binding protein (PEBP) family uncharacterized protein
MPSRGTSDAPAPLSSSRISVTSFGGSYYRGPSKQGSKCTFKLYALSSRLELPRGATKEAVVGALKGKVLAKATLTGTL